MNPPDKEKLRQLTIDNARRQLETRTWAQVMAVFEYETPRSPRKSAQEFRQLEAFFEEEMCRNIVAFLAILHSEEEKKGVTMSFNVQLRRRSVPGEAPLPPENFDAFMSTPDMLLGTRGGLEGAFDAVKKLADGSEALPSVVLSIFDNIFGEVNEVMKNPGKTITFDDMVKVAIG